MNVHSSFFTDQDAKSQFYLTDISVDHTDDAANGDHSSLDMTELVIFGLTDAPDGKSFPLVKASRGQWKVEASIELPKCVKGIEIITRSKEGWDVGFTHLDYFNLQTGAIDSECGKNTGGLTPMHLY
ncbi:hypothetical protein EST38_g8706 [Candolleomyces aberdarensis]|uniref:Uncharacterized protein n=1 Tax=Candolleomyces aberdarensis TaxID=2316362 RepID=A0A4Q2DBS7_9AGAR|nr:hypothetical protein EST38_g8706 [Candolleomyces aberdarensis]